MQYYAWTVCPLQAIFRWPVVSAVIYKATQSVFACALYHAFIQTIGAIYDWNALFDAYPKTAPMLLYFAGTVLVSIVIWMVADKAERSQREHGGRGTQP